MEPSVVNTTPITNESFTFAMSKACAKAGKRFQLLDEVYTLYKNNPGWMDLDFAIFAVIVSVIAVMGLAGNGILVVVLRKSKCFAIVAPYFICLAVCDSMFIVLNHFGSCIQFGLKHMIDLKFLCGTYQSYYSVYAHSFTRSFFCSTAFLMGALAITRVISVFRPLSSKKWLTSKFNWRLAISLSVVPQILNIFFFCGTFVRDCLDVDGSVVWNVWQQEDVTFKWLNYIFTMAPAFYSGYIIWTVIVVLNVVLMWKLREIRRQRRRLTESSQTDNTIRVTALLLCVTVTCCILVLPSYAQIILDMYVKPRGFKGICTFPTKINAQRMNYGFRLLLTLNSSVNFYWFLLFGTGFRGQVANALLFWKKATSTK